MSTLKSTSGLKATTASFNEMIKRFGVVTVMNARVYKQPLKDIVPGYEELKVHEIVAKLDQKKKDTDYIVLDTLKIANINMEGPDKTVTGGQYANPLIKYGKSATIEMQDALGNAEALELFGICSLEDFAAEGYGNTSLALHFTEDFAGPKTILGESFFIDQTTGSQVPVRILLYQVLPDSIMNLTQDSEGDATVFDLNGSLLTTTIKIGVDNVNENDIKKGVFYSVIPAKLATAYQITYAKAENGTSVDDFVIDALNNDPAYTITDAAGKITIPETKGYEFYKDQAGTETQVNENSAETLTSNVTWYVKPQA